MDAESRDSNGKTPLSWEVGEQQHDLFELPHKAGLNCLWSARKGRATPRVAMLDAALIGS